ncbi:MAG: hypothetical protein VCD00_09935 [Candidatus Hydrogenedentota bacterium]
MLTTVLVLATIQFWTAQFQPGYISQLGVYHGGQWKAQSGDDWLAMIPTAKGFELVDTTVYAEHAVDEMFDEPGQMSGIRVSTPSWTHPTYLFQGLATLRPGVVPTLYNGFHPLAPSQSLILKNPYPDVELYRLSATGNREGNVLFKNYTLHLDYRQNGHSTVTQELVFYEQLSEEAYPRLLWAGDLDGDNKLDLIMDITYHYNVQHLVLYLSSYAAAGELVRLAAELKTSGC